MNSIKDILQDLGYQISNDGSTNYSCKPLYRDSDNNKALSICKKTGKWFDFVIAKGGSLETLIKNTLNFETDDEVEYWLKNKNYQINEISEKLVLKMPKIFNPQDYFALPHKYFENKGISPETMRIFGHGVCHGDSQRNRYVFLIPEESGNIIGIAGRLVTKEIPDANGKIGKWKIQGSKKNFIYPYFINRLDIEAANSVILVESIGDFLALYESGLKQGLVLFGVNISQAMLSKLIEINPARIIIATNNDEDKKSVGNRAATEIYEKLSKFFDTQKLFIGCPTNTNDLFDLFQKEGKSGIIDWYQNLFILE